MSVIDPLPVDVPMPVAQGAACHVELSESSEGWLLRLTLGADVAEYLAQPLAAGHQVLAPGQVSVSIRPNLVPGEPFGVAAVQIVLAPPVAEATKERRKRP